MADAASIRIGVVGGEAAGYAVGEHPGAWLRDSLGRALPALCRRQPAFRSLMARWLDAAASDAARSAVARAGDRAGRPATPEG